MLTLAAQVGLSLCVLVFALLARRLADELPGSARGFRDAWALAGVAFFIQGVNAIIHDVFAIHAYASGPESRAWAAILEWHAILNHSRTFLLTTFSLILCAGLLRANAGRSWPSTRTSVALLVGGMLIGGLVGRHEAAFSGVTHYTAVAVWDVMEMLALFAALLVGVSTGRMDRALWLALAINAFTVAFSGLGFAALAEIDLGGWHPLPHQIHLAKLALYLTINMVAYRHLKQVRRGHPVRGFFETHPREPAASFYH